MIGKVVKSYLLENEDQFLIPAANAVHLMETNPLSHALLVLSQVRFTKVCVLNKKSELIGLVSMSDILSASYGTTEIDNDKLQNTTVGDIMERDFHTLTIPYEIEKVLHELVDYPFVPVVDDQNKFQGIVTRRELLKSVNRLAHLLESQYTLTEKVPAKKCHADTVHANLKQK